MFTGIIECMHTLQDIRREGDSIHYSFQSPIAEELKVDQSIAHDGACLTVTAVQHHSYTVTAVKETLDKTILKHWEIGDLINIERCLKIGDRLDGHMVQGHVDTTATITKIEKLEGSWLFYFSLDAPNPALLVSKGSITINGVSLTLIEDSPENISVTIIPYTYQHTNFHRLSVGNKVNIEYDILGKYISKLYAKHSSS